MTAAPGPALARILVVEDDPTVADVVLRYLRREGYAVRHAADGPAALAALGATPPDLVVLDVMLPGLDGLEVCRRIRRGDGGPHPAVPVIMLTALAEEGDRIAGLETGADDYLSKPFSPRELVLRVRSVLRRGAAAPAGDSRPEPLRDGDLTLDLAARQAALAGTPLSLTGREFELLAFFLARPRRAFSREELLERVWGWTVGDQSTVTVHVRRLREKIEPDPARPQRITTAWGVGYRYEPAARP